MIAAGSKHGVVDTDLGMQVHSREVEGTFAVPTCVLTVT